MRGGTSKKLRRDSKERREKERKEVREEKREKGEGRGRSEMVMERLLQSALIKGLLASPERTNV